MRTLQSYMKKLCILLINELKRMGAHIVFADLTRVIVCTNKLSVEDAVPYMEYLIKNLQSKDLFNTIHIDTNKVWTLLMWNDSANFAGIKLDLSNESQEEEIEMNWKISSFLPEIVQDNFKTLIAGYLGSISETVKDLHLKAKNKTPDSPGSKEEETENIVTFSQKLISGEMTEQLMRLTQKIYKRLTDEDFPTQLGCRYKLRCPALEFVKYITKALSLDKNIMNQCNKLKKDLLKIVNVREFSDEAQYTDPSLSFVVPQMICMKCNHCRDVDLCRDPCSNLDENDKSKPIGWYCSNCGEYYDIKKIEYFLIESLHTKLMSHVTQDIKCVRCKEVRGTFLQKYCECSGVYENLLGLDDASYLVKALHNFTKHVKLTRLENELDFITKYNPNLLIEGKF